MHTLSPTSEEQPDAKPALVPVSAQWQKKETQKVLLSTQPDTHTDA
jgi:hypothetical protein